MILLPTDKCGVRPTETPTVPKAENTSYINADDFVLFKPILSISNPLSKPCKAKKAIKIVVTANKTRDMALTITSLE